MPSDLQVTNLKANDGTAGISIADSTGRVSFTETNPSITLGSNATFPTGHIINFQQNKGTAAYSTTRDGWTTSGSSPGTVADAEVTITPSSSSNKIVLHLSGLYTGSSNTSLGISLYKNASDVTETYNLPGTDYGLSLISNTDNDTYSLNYCDTAGTTNQITYRISFRSFNSSYSVGLGHAEVPTVLLVYEIKA
tara:strand:- start:266 stop:847 length:582 start_codon:yes stop_codon:yes gene_type:complete